jgi:hypothetical protein
MSLEYATSLSWVNLPSCGAGAGGVGEMVTHVRFDNSQPSLTNDDRQELSRFCFVLLLILVHTKSSFSGHWLAGGQGPDQAPGLITYDLCMLSISTMTALPITLPFSCLVLSCVQRVGRVFSDSEMSLSLVTILES